MSFLIKDDMFLDKYNKIWGKIKGKLNIKFHSMPAYDEKYIIVKVREFNGVIKTNFSGDEIPKEDMHYTCIACITIDSVMRMEKKNYPQELSKLKKNYQKKKNVGYFADFGQVKKQPYNKTPRGETGCLSNFLGCLSMCHRHSALASQICEGFHQL